MILGSRDPRSGDDCSTPISLPNEKGIPSVRTMPHLAIAASIPTAKSRLAKVIYLVDLFQSYAASATRAVSFEDYAAGAPASSY